MAAVAGETEFGVLPVGGGKREPPDIAVDAAAAAEWWKGISHGCWHPKPVLLPPVLLSDDPACWCAGGGLGAGPRNAPGLVRSALLALPDEARKDGPRLVIAVVNGPIAPHVWRVAEGGVAIAPGIWVRRYAALPVGSPVGPWVHEMAHLLLDWPDLPESTCLMGKGAARNGGNDPAPPGAAMRLRAGWIREISLTAAMRIGDLAPDEMATLTWGSRRIGVSRSGDGIVVDDLESMAGPLATIPSPDPNNLLLDHVFGQSSTFVQPGDSKRQ